MSFSLFFFFLVCGGADRGSGNVPMDEERMEAVRRAVEEAGVKVGEGGKGGGWEGGVVWLVPTDRPIGQWKPIAVREL